jgi:ABC-type branched-subunit amino acid transport system substrate-binding protein
MRIVDRQDSSLLRIRRRPWTIGVAVVIAALSLVLTACSSSKSSGGSGGASSVSGGSSAAAPKGDIKIMLAGTIQSAAFGFPEAVAGAQAAASAINDAGGIKGQKIVIEQCNDQLDPNVATACGRTAVSDKVAAVVEVETDYIPEMLTALIPAKIPVLADNPGNPPELTGATVFPIGGGSYSIFAALGGALVKDGNCQKVAIVVLNLAATEISGNNIANSVKQAGGTVTGIQDVSPTLPNYSSVVATAIQQGAQCIAQVLGPAQAVQLVTAIKTSSSPHMIMGGAAGDFTPDSFAPLASTLEGGIATSVTNLLPESEVNGAAVDSYKPFYADMSKYQSKATVDSESLMGWQGVTLFAEAAKHVDTVTAANILKAMGDVDNFTLSGVPNPVSYKTPNKDPKMARVFDTNVLVYKIQDGKYVLQPGGIDIQDALSTFLAKS